MANAHASSQSLIAVFLDIEKGFDRTWHAGVLHKLHGLGLKGHFPLVIQNFLQNRTFNIKLEDTFSDSLQLQNELQNGIPQGSVLSPTLFSIMFNDFLSTASPTLKYSLYADDCALWASTHDFRVAENRVQHGLHDAQCWALQWGF